MRAITLAVVLGSLLVLGERSFAGEPPSETSQADPPPGGIELLPGYTHKSGRGTDTHVGEIRKEGGITIQYDIGWLAGNYVEAKKDQEFRWYKEQTIDGKVVQMLLAKDDTLYVSFPQTPEQSSSANFQARVSSSEDIADVLLMTLTYNPTKKPK